MPGRRRNHRACGCITVAMACALAASPARAAADSVWRQAADRVFHQVEPNVDVPNALVPRTITEGPDGYLWFGGDAGLVRWDGYEFRDYPAEPTRPDGIRNSDITALHRDQQGRLWAATLSGGLARYDAAQERLRCVPLDPGPCAVQQVFAITDDGAGGLWVGVRGGLRHLDANGQVILPSHFAGLAEDDVLSLLRDHRGVLWAGTPHGVFSSADGGRNFTRLAPLREPHLAVTNMMEDAAGRLWLGTRQHGAFMVAADRASVSPITATAPPAPSEPAVEVNALLEISPGTIWIATEGHGIVEVNAATGMSHSIMRNPLVPNGLPANAVESLYRDRSGLIWLGTNAGMATYHPEAGVMPFFTDPDRRDGLPGDGVLSLLVTHDKSLWVGLQGAGFVIFDPTGRRAGGLPGRRVYTMAPAPAGGVLLGTDGGLFLANDRGQVGARLVVPELNGNTAIHALRTAGGIVWLGTNDEGVWALRIGADGEVSSLRHIAAAELTNGATEVINVAPDGRIAIGTDSGFTLVDPGSGAIEQVASDPGDKLGLAPGFVGSFANDGLHRLWVGTSNGLNIMTGRDAAGHPRFRHLGTADGLPNPSVNSLLADGHGRVWASTDHGLAVIDEHSLAVRALQRPDGIAVTNYWTDSMAMLPDGELAFGGIGGMTIVQPDAVSPWTYRPPVVVTALRVGGQPLRGQPAQDALVVVPPDANSLSVEFAALDYSAPAQNRYSYHLDGFDAGWMVTDSRHRIADYTNLPPGEYRLHLRGSNRAGVWSEPDTTLRIRVLPAWYQTVWFRAVAIGAAIVLALAGLRRWTEVLRRRRRELERQVATRTLQLSESRQQLQTANAELESRVEERTQALAERSAALEASEARFRAWFDHAEDAMFVVQVHPDGRFTYEALNAAVARIFGVDPATGTGRAPAEVLPPGYVDLVLERYREATRGEPVHYETSYPGASGERLLDTWIVPLRNAVTGRVVRLVGASRDLTDRRALEARLAQAQKLQALGGLAGGIAHDFNNILQAVAGAAMLMEQRPDDQDKVLRLARSTQAAAQRGTSITRRLLAFARSDALSVAAIPTEEVLAGIADVLKFTLGSAITVTTAFAAALPPLLADRGQLETALVNLGTNARDAMPAGGTLTLAAYPEAVPADPGHPAGLPEGAYVRIDVTDTGTGMDAATLTRAMEPFFTTKPQGQGTGLGLAQVKGFAEQSGGQMIITSRPGQGTTVSLWLRVARGQSAGAASVTPAHPPRTALRETILVVDDDQLVRETLGEQLRDAGFAVQIAESGVAAIAMLRTGPAPDGMICDLSMPGLDGVQTIRAARALHPKLCCFLLTGYAGERGGLENAEGFTLLLKPIPAAALVAQIETSFAALRR